MRSTHDYMAAASAFEPLAVLVCPWSSLSSLDGAARAVSDWSVLLRRAGEEGVAGLLAAQVAERPELPVPHPVRERLAAARQAAAHRSLAHVAVLVRVVDELAAAGVVVLALKGPLLSKDLYGDESLRTFADLDLVVRPTELHAALDRLLAGGFGLANSEMELILKRGGGENGEVLLAGPEGPPYVDLHWHLSVGLSRRRFPLERLFGDARELSLLEHHVLVPGEQDQLLLGTLHAARHHADTLEARLAVAALVRRTPEAAWPAILADAGALGMRRRLVAVVAASCPAFGVPVPKVVERALARDGVAAAYARHLRRPAGRSAVSAQRRAPALVARADLWRAASEDSAARGLTLLMEKVFRPGPRDWLVVDLPPWLSWAYWLLRPARLCVSCAREVGRTPRGG